MREKKEGRHHKIDIDPEEKAKANQKRYLNSELGKAVTRRYGLSEKGKKAREKYLNSEKGKAAKLRYLLSDKGVQYVEKQSQKLSLAYRCMKWLENNPGKTSIDFYNLLTQEQEKEATNE